MHEYDITLKGVLRRLTGSVLREITGFKVSGWHNAELPEVRSLRADMLGEASDGSLIHIELQSTNRSAMALRMLEYATAIHRQFGRFPHQGVLEARDGAYRVDVFGRVEETGAGNLNGRWNKCRF